MGRKYYEGEETDSTENEDKAQDVEKLVYKLQNARRNDCLNEGDY